MVMVLGLEPLDRGPLRHFTILATDCAYTLEHRQDGTVIRLCRAEVDDLVAARPDTCDPIDVLLDLLPPLCEECGQKLADRDRSLCRECERSQLSFLQKTAGRPH